MLQVLLLACTPSTDSAKQTDTGTDTVVLGTPPDVERVELETEDGVVLVADYYGQTAPTPGVVLIHMVPPYNDRTSWPVDFIEALRAEGFSVLNIDRRGAGESGGEAADAYGALGVFDAYAAVDRLSAEAATQVHMVGASNGSTTALDYAVEAEADGRPALTSLVWMSPGTYTTAQHEVDELTLGRVAELYPTSEANWAERAQGKAENGDEWTLIEYDPGGHGTDLFTEAPEVSTDLVDWLVASR
jgi:alpha-beta hydrolase superfamily lysophospholipase